MVEATSEQPDAAPPAPETSTEVAAAPSATEAPAAATPAAEAAPLADDDAPKSTVISTDIAKPTEPTATDAEPATADDKTATGINGDKDAPAADTSAANGTPASAKKDNKRRKSSAAVPEHKGKSLKKKQSMLHLGVQPGEVWWVRMKGFPPWPGVICDEEMLPEALLSNRPVSAMRTNGSYREDFMEGGKNARDRRYPVMFLGTNEFNWIVNTDLQPLDLDDIKAELAKENRGKKTIALWEAYQVAVEEKTLDEYKEMLRKHEEYMQADIAEKREKAEKRAEKEAAKKDKAEKRKSQGAKDDDGDEVMGGAGESGKKKKSAGGKRKAEAQEPDDTPQQGPKKLKIKNKDADAANEENKKKQSKPRKPAKSKEGETAKPTEPEMSEKEKLEKKEKHILYLRHRLQKGFLSRDQAPKEDEMDGMNDYFNQLEEHLELEVSIIRATKINKVLKAILKLEEIPKDADYKFKDRSNTLLNNWNKLLSSGGAGDGEAVETPTTTDAPKPTLNGASLEGDSTKTENDTVMSELAEAPKETSANIGNNAGDEADADVSMTDAKSIEAEAPAAPAAEEVKPAPAAGETTATA